MSTVTTPHARVLIDNRTIDTEMAPVHNPAATSEIVGYVARAGESDVESAVRSSERAAGAWAALPVHERAARMAAALPEWAATLDERATLLTREQGKVLWESVADCRGPELVTRYFVENAADVLAPERTDDARGATLKRHVPFGVTAVVVPWNYPVYLAFQHVAPALISGNTVIVKTPENAPLSLQVALETLAGKLPDGVLNMVPGSGSVVGAALAAHPRVRKVLFTGSLPVGRAVLAGAAPTIKSVGLELGGNDPAIILPGRPIDDELIGEMVRGVFTCTGQVCFNIKRIFVPEEIREEFVERLIAAVDTIAVGPGLDRRSTIGPINNEKEYTRLQKLLTSVRNSGATPMQEQPGIETGDRVAGREDAGVH